MRYTAFLLLGFVLVLLQGQLYTFMGPLIDRGYRPSLLIPLLVYLGVTETNLSLGASVAFLLGYVLDVTSGAPIGLFTFTSVATIALTRMAGIRIVTQGGISRALLAGGFALLSSIIALVLLAIFGKGGYVPRRLFKFVLPHALATAIVSPLVYRLAAKVQFWAAGFLDPNRAPVSNLKRAGSVLPRPASEEKDG